MDRNARQRKEQRRLFRVLFVCTANICRSPMAEGILKDLAEKTERVGLLDVQSAGVAAINGARASDFARDVSREAGIDISRHRSQPVTDDLLRKTDLVLVMTASHKRDIDLRYPDYADTVFLLREYGQGRGLSGDLDVEDPYGSNKEDYRRCFEQLHVEIERVMPEIREAIKAI